MSEQKRDASHDYVAVQFREDLTDENGKKLDVYTTPIVDLMAAVNRLKKEAKKKGKE